MFIVFCSCRCQGIKFPLVSLFLTLLLSLGSPRDLFLDKVRDVQFFTCISLLPHRSSIDTVVRCGERSVL